MAKDGTAVTEQGAITPNETYTESQNSASIDENEKAQELLKDKQAEEGIESSSDMLAVDSVGSGEPMKKVSETPQTVNVSDDYKELDDDEQKPDWVLTKLSTPYDTKELMSLYGAEGFTDLKSLDEYWEDPELKKRFVDKFGFSAKKEFNTVYNNLKQEFSNYQLNRFSRGVTAYELAKDDLTKLAMGTTYEYMNKEGSVMEGFEWGAATRDVRQSAKRVRFQDGTFEDYSAELLASLEMEEGFDGLAYSDSTLQSDPRSSEEDSYYDVIFDGQITLPDNTTRRVSDDAIVSRWDINTGSVLDGWFNNNKLEADSPWDYAKILVRGVDNMWYGVMDTLLMVPKLALTGSYGVAGWFTEDDPDVLTNDVYKAITSMQVRNKGNLMSSSQEAMQDGFFGSAESFLGTVFDVALQVAFGAALGRVGRGVGKIVSKKATPEAALAAQQAWAKNTVRTTLTAYAAKDSYNEALDNGFTIDEATMITGATVFALWKATALADYMVGEYEPKVLRETIRKIVGKEQQQFLKTAFKKVVEVGSKGNEQKAALSLKTMTKALDKVFAPMKDLAKKMPAATQRIMYEAKQEGLEEMSEELYQDLVKQGFTAYGAITQKLTGEKQGGYMSIFEDGYFKDAAERYATSGIAGAIGGPMGMVNQRISLSSITDTSSIVDIISSGNKDQLLTVLRDMKTNGELGPSNLSTEYNEELAIFEPIMDGTEGATSLSDMVYNTYLYDIATIDNFISKGMFGQARQKMEQDAGLKDYVDGNAMRKDFGIIMGKMLTLLQKTGISPAVFKEMDALTDEQLVDYMPQEIQDRIDKSNEEIKDIQERIKKRKETAASKIAPPDADEPEVTPKEPIMDPKDKEKKDEEEDNLQRLQKEVELSSEVTNKDLTDLFGLYRKVRAIANGTASEHYFMQHSMYESKVFGDMRIRDEEFKDLGKNAFADQLMAMRNRAVDDKKLLVFKKEKALETEDRLDAIVDNTDEGIISMLKILDSVPTDVLTAKAHAKIAEYFMANSDKITGILATAYDPDSPNSIFLKNDDGTVNDEDVLERFLQVLHSSDMNIGVENNPTYMNHITNNDLAKEFFRNFSNDPLGAQIPVYREGEYDASRVEVSNAPGYAYDLIEKFGGAVASPINELPQHLRTLKRAYSASLGILKNDTYFVTANTQIRNVRSLFKTGKGIDREGQYELSNTKLIDSAASAGAMFLSNRLPGDIFYQKDSTDVDNILKQIKIKEGITAELTKYSSMRGKEALASLRKNVLEILNFTYNPGEEPSSRVEKHSYKDYTQVTDFFVDFIGDPIKSYEIGLKEMKGEELNEDEKAFTAMNSQNLMLMNTSYLEKADENDPDGKDKLRFGNINEIALDRFLNDSFDDLAGSKNIMDALAFMRENKIEVPGDIIEGGDPTVLTTIYTDGITQLKIAEWVMKGLKAKIEVAADISNSTPYIQDKENDIDTTYQIFDKLLNAPGMELVQQYVEDYVDGYKGVIDTTIKTEKARINIGIEKAIYDIYNDKVKLDGPTTGMEKAIIDDYIVSVFTSKEATDARVGNVSGQADALAPAVLIGAITTDYTTTFYPKFKSYIELSTDEDPIVLASQEHSAKYAASYVFSRKFKEKVDELIGKRYFGDYKQNRHLLAVLGTAGSGKTTAVTKLGMTLAIDILKDMGYTNTQVLPVSNNQGQIDLLYKSLGDLSDGENGLLVADLHQLLIDANGGNQEAIDRLKSTGAILIDEVTYIDARDRDMSRGKGRKSLLTKMTDLVDKFNSDHASANNPISVVVMGDPKQTGAHQEGSTTMQSTAITTKSIMSLSYMGHSFRNNNSFLVDSLKAIDPGTRGTGVIPRGVKYGTSNGNYYGVNIVNPANKSNDSEFQDILNDDALIKSIKKNIKKVNDANEGKEEGDKSPLFKVMIVVPSETDWGGMSNKMKKVAEEFPDNFMIKSYNSIGGSEANYVIGEFPVEPFGPQEYNTSMYTRGLRNGLFTLASRAFDFAYIVNRNKDIEIPEANKSKNMGDGQVVIPDNSISDKAKQKVREMYKEILADIDIEAKADVDEDAPAGTEEIIVSTDDDDGDSEGSGKGKKPGPKPKPKPKPEPKPRKKKKKKPADPDPEQDENEDTDDENMFTVFSDPSIISVAVDQIISQPMTADLLTDYYDMLYNLYAGVEGYTQELVSDFYNTHKDALDTYAGIDTGVDPTILKDPQALATKLAELKYIALIFSIELDFYGKKDKDGVLTSDVLHNMEVLVRENTDQYNYAIEASRSDLFTTNKKAYEKLLHEVIKDAIFFTKGSTEDARPKRVNKFIKDMGIILQAQLDVLGAEAAEAEIDDNVDDNIMEDGDFEKFDAWLTGRTPKEVLNVIHQLKTLPKKLLLDPSAKRLFKRYPTKHKLIISELMRRAIDAKSKNLSKVDNKDAMIEQGDAEESITSDTDFTLLAEYKRLLGIDPNIISAPELYQAIRDAQQNFWVDPNIDNTDGNALKALQDIPNVWRRLFGKSFGTLSNSKLGPTRKNSQDEYISRISNLRGNDVIAVLRELNAGVLKYNLGLVDSRGEDGLDRVLLRDPEAALNLFNFDDKAENLADGIELRGVKNAQGYVQVFLVIAQGDNRYVVSQLNNDLNKAKRNKETKEAFAVSDATIERFKQEFEKRPGQSVIDIPLKGKPGSNIFLKTGAVLLASEQVLEEAPEEGTQTVTIDELSEQGVNFSSNIYVNTEKGTSQSGESYLLYSWNKGIVLGTDDHLALLQKGVFTGPVADRESILDETGVVPTEISRVPLRFKPALADLKQAVTEIKGTSFPQFASRFAQGMQKYISDDILNGIVFDADGKPDFEKSAKIMYYTKRLDSTDAEGNIINEKDANYLHEEKLTMNLYKKAVEMRNGYDAYIEANKKANPEVGAAIESGILTDLDKMKAANASHIERTGVNILALLAGGYKMNNLTKNKSYKNDQDIIVKKSSKSGVYIFNLDAYLKNHSESLLRNVDVLFSVTSTEIAIPTIKGSSNGVVGVADPRILKMFAGSLFLKDVVGIGKPGIVINSEGVSSINSQLDSLGKGKKVNFNKGEKVRRNSIFNGTYLDSIKDMDKDSLINEQDVVNTIKEKLKFANSTPLSDMNKIDAALDAIAMELLNTVSVVDTRLATMFDGVDMTAEILPDAVQIASNLLTLRDNKEASNDVEGVEIINKVLKITKIYKTAPAETILAVVTKKGLPEEIINTCKL